MKSKVHISHITYCSKYFSPDNIVIVLISMPSEKLFAPVLDFFYFIADTNNTKKGVLSAKANIGNVRCIDKTLTASFVSK